MWILFILDQSSIKDKNKNFEETLLEKLDDISILSKANSSICMKIDVEGYELDVLKGGVNFLRNTKKCVVLLKYWKCGFNKIANFLKNFGFTNYRKINKANAIFIKGL